MDGHHSEWSARASQFCQAIQPTNAHVKPAKDYNKEDNIFLFEELTDLIPQTTAHFVSTNTQVDKDIDILAVNEEKQTVSRLLFLC